MPGAGPPADVGRRGLDDRSDLIGGNGNDTLTAGAGNSRLRGGAGADALDGTGNDLADYYDSDAGVTVNLATGTAQGGHAEGDTFTGIKDIYGSLLDDHLAGDDEGNLLLGDAGDDTLDGGAGDDKLQGREGNDVFDGGAGAGVLDGGADGGYDSRSLATVRDDVWGGRVHAIRCRRDGQSGDGHRARRPPCRRRRQQLILGWRGRRHNQRERGKRAAQRLARA